LNILFLCGKNISFPEKSAMFKGLKAENLAPGGEHAVIF